MKSNYKENEAKSYIKKYAKRDVPKDLALRIYTTQLLGNDPTVVLHGGGNTSVKSSLDTLIGEKEEITKADLYKAYSKGMKMMSGTKEFKAHQEKISKMRKALKMNEGKKWDSYKKAVATVLGKKKEQRTAQKAMDAGARLRRKKQRQEYAAKVSGSEDLVPDDIRD